MTREDFDEAMACLVDSGQVLACCPQCTLALSIQEYNSQVCKSCGSYDSEEVKFYPNNNKC